MHVPTCFSRCGNVKRDRDREREREMFKPRELSQHIFHNCPWHMGLTAAVAYRRLPHIL